MKQQTPTDFFSDFTSIIDLFTSRLEEDKQTQETSGSTSPLQYPNLTLSEEDSLIERRLGILKKTIQKPFLKKMYHNISNQLRMRLLDAVNNNGEKIKHAAKRLGINYSSAKSICQIYRREGRTEKMFLKRKVSKEATPVQSQLEDPSLSFMTNCFSQQQSEQLYQHFFSTPKTMSEPHATVSKNFENGNAIETYLNIQKDFSLIQSVSSFSPLQNDKTAKQSEQSTVEGIRYPFNSNNEHKRTQFPKESIIATSFFEKASHASQSYSDIQEITPEHFSYSLDMTKMSNLQYTHTSSRDDSMKIESLNRNVNFFPNQNFFSSHCSMNHLKEKDTYERPLDTKQLPFCCHIPQNIPLPATNIILVQTGNVNCQLTKPLTGYYWENPSRCIPHFNKIPSLGASVSQNII